MERRQQDSRHCRDWQRWQKVLAHVNLLLRPTPVQEEQEQALQRL